MNTRQREMRVRKWSTARWSLVRIDLVACKVYTDRGRVVLVMMLI